MMSRVQLLWKLASKLSKEVQHVTFQLKMLTWSVPEPCQPGADVIVRCRRRVKVGEACVVNRALTHVLGTRGGILGVKQLTINLTFQLTHQIL